MKDSQAGLSKINLQKGILLFEGSGFLLAILTLWVTEYLDPPFSYMQVIIESTIIGVWGWITVYLTWRLYPKD